MAIHPFYKFKKKIVNRMANGVSPFDSQFFLKFTNRMASDPFYKFKKKFLNG